MATSSAELEVGMVQAHADQLNAHDQERGGVLIRTGSTRQNRDEEAEIARSLRQHGYRVRQIIHETTDMQPTVIVGRGIELRGAEHVKKVAEFAASRRGDQ